MDTTIKNISLYNRGLNINFCPRSTLKFIQKNENYAIPQHMNERDRERKT